VPCLRWITVNSRAHPAGACTIFAARLPLSSYRQMPRLLWFAIRVGEQLRRTPGLLGYAMDLDLRQATLWITSAWTHRAGLARFDRTGAHLRATQALRAVLLPPAFAVWTYPIDQLPVPWHETRERLSIAGRRARRGGIREGDTSGHQ
jgi:hypothetical protein